MMSVGSNFTVRISSFFCELLQAGHEKSLSTIQRAKKVDAHVDEHLAFYSRMNPLR
jgi:hypothetical protein